MVALYFALAFLVSAGQVYAQFTDPHNYDNTPVGLNQLELDYGYAHSNASIDTSLLVPGAQFNLNTGVIDYTRYFGFVHRLMWAEASVPLGGLSGAITGTNIRGSTTGAGDSSYVLAMLLKGGPALSVAQFANYKPATVLGLSFAMTAPTGQYDPNKLLNLGTDRWSFKPEFGISRPFGPGEKWQFDGYANAYFFTDNSSYRGREILRQQALPGFEGHLSYAVLNSLWVSVDTRYSFRGDTSVNGMDQDNAQQNFLVGSEVNVSLSSKNTLVFEFAKPVLHKNGPTYTGFVMKYSYTWGKGYR